MTVTEDMRLSKEIETLSYAELVEYAVEQQEKMQAAIDDPENSLEKVRYLNRLPRKRALYAAKKIFENRPEMYESYMKKLNRMCPRYYTAEECKKYGISSSHPVRGIAHFETPYVRPEVYRFGFMHRQKD